MLLRRSDPLVLLACAAVARADDVKIQPDVVYGRKDGLALTFDVRRAVRFIRLQAADYDVDSDRLGVWGGSAGGRLTLMPATTGDDGDPQAKDPLLKASSRIRCGVSLCPPTDLRQ